jgi:hypothetical protein
MAQRVLLALVVCGALGCGHDDSPAASCFKVAPCGGDLVGEWRLEAICVQRATLEASFAASIAGGFCPTQTLGAVTRGVSGSLVMNADLTFMMTGTLSGSTDFTVPASCLTGTNCAAVNASLQAEIASHPEVVSASCSGSASCLCREVISVPFAGSGTYSTAGSALTADAPLDDSQYCVQGDTVHFLTSTMPGLIDADLVATRVSAALVAELGSMRGM